MPNLKDFTKKVLDDFATHITDKVFLLIQNDRELLQEYLHLVEDKKLNTVNAYIGKEVKKRFGLSNIQEREDLPESTLIQSHQKFD